MDWKTLIMAVSVVITLGGIVFAMGKLFQRNKDHVEAIKELKKATAEELHKIRKVLFKENGELNFRTPESCRERHDDLKQEQNTLLKQLNTSIQEIKDRLDKYIDNQIKAAGL